MLARASSAPLPGAWRAAGMAIANHLQQFPLVAAPAPPRDPRGGITTMTYQWPITVIHLHITEAQRTR